ncbi:ABC transporter ATP-binding protein, partial [Veillonellaceae bacterium M2-4]|nr:ABC transporter ATP-binding protein [Veillonellaceae bacterium M2-4]
MNELLAVQNIKRYFKGKNKTIFKAVDGISFILHKGEVISFVGPNGAGKTTLIRSISGYLVPTSGKIER